VEYRGKQYSVVQGLDSSWKWSFELDGHTKSGNAPNRQAAIKFAEKKIDRALPRKRSD
jgi:hypothetical protein